MAEKDENKEKVHGNSKKSDKDQHLYEVRDIENDKTWKWGISGEELNKDGSSPRANAQVNLLNRVAGCIKFIAIIIIRVIKGRAKALEEEKKITKKWKDDNNSSIPPEGQKLPDP